MRGSFRDAGVVSELYVRPMEAAAVKQGYMTQGGSASIA